MSNHLTLHIVASVPYSNLNRDDTGTPKHVRRGGYQAALLSSQAIKKGIRTKYENGALVTSLRSGQLEDVVVQRALEIDPSADEKALKKAAKKIIGDLTKADKGGEAKDGKESARSIWLSSEELEVAAAQVLGNADAEFLQDGKTGSLAIAAFGRMFAAAPQKGTEAALSVSPAVTSHAVNIATDYFSTVDDVKEANRESGATFLGVAQYTSGVFYRTVSIDKEQLRQSWTGFDSEDAEKSLALLIDAIIYGLPRGKQHSTAPFVQPALVLAEEQRYRSSYDFEAPVQADRANGGFLEPTLSELNKQYEAARAFDASNFDGLEFVAGTATSLDDKFKNATKGSKDELVAAVVAWIKQ
ncbi:MAG: type I-E CRISPR-associated protein Cas7/Cse4/CasC [Corynebacterium sp.]|uniref:type I-E CRISPR-associated protein Cas7/Cse4/CasC n=1 Tax=Corynebacterium sp. TaxID=1720 RepID=UPI0026DDBA8A|nr:type I-E CRISPR-associated protein Cas7/Cse4/CasC [Corynebacterium sp.]MDO4762321.1 type I-E CRISPR-associated protein Cas7/Cse4/CasC [Corynebacterium sp.]